MMEFTLLEAGPWPPVPVVRRYAWFLIVVALLSASPATAQPADPVSALVVRIEQALGSGDPAALPPLFAPGVEAAQVDGLVAESARERTTRAVVRERDRTELPSGGARIIADVFVETAGMARVTTWRFDIGRTAGESVAITAAARLSVVDGLVRLSLSEKQYAVRNLRIRGEDLTLTVPSGVAYLSEVNGNMTGLVVLGEGDIVFSPEPESEKGQLRLFAGEETLRTRVSRVFLRINPVDAPHRITLDALRPVETDRAQLDRARRFFTEQSGLSYSLDLNDLSRDSWNLVPPIGDLLVDMDLSRYGLLSYARSGGDAEDVSLFDRRKRKNISVYTSQDRLARRGTRAYSDERQIDYRIDHYNVDVNFDPQRLWIEGRADLDLVVTSAAAQTITLRLAEPLVLRSVTSDELGRLLALRVRGQNNIVINLPDSLRAGQRLRLRVAYGGRLPPMSPDREALALGQPLVSELALEPEPRYVYSNRSYWYPQSTVSSYATALLRISVPADFSVLATGIPEPPAPAKPANDSAKPRRAFVFRALQPARYLSMAVSRFTPVVTTELSRSAPDVTVPSPAGRLSRSGPGVFYDGATVEVWAQPRQTGRARDIAPTATEILKFYGDLVDDLPYPTFRLALVEDTLPGGHSPAYFAIVHQPLPGTPFTWARDPVAFDDFPQFFLAHELAHQFWGQAVAGENYHEQWLSEGFSQYFAYLYAEKVRSRDTATGIVRQMYRSALEASDQGPIWLGYRLGHLKSDTRVFRATVYNKGALVLHMLRRMVGEDAFSRGLQRFYGASRFRRVGTDQLRQAFETETGQSLERFFERWVYGADVPTLRASWETVEPATAGADGQAPTGEAVRLTLEQPGLVHDVPLTVTVQYLDGRTEQALVVTRDAMTQVELPVTGRIRELRFNEDFGALVRVERGRR
jgi:hypothetical protein